MIEFFSLHKEEVAELVSLMPIGVRAARFSVSISEKRGTSIPQSKILFLRRVNPIDGFRIISRKAKSAQKYFAEIDGKRVLVDTY